MAYVEFFKPSRCTRLRVLCKNLAKAGALPLQRVHGAAQVIILGRADALVHVGIATSTAQMQWYRNQYSSDAMVQELAGSQEAFAPALLKTQMMLSAQGMAMFNDGKKSFQKFAVLRVAPNCGPCGPADAAGICAPRVPHFLLPERPRPYTGKQQHALIESQLDQWMAEFHTYLALPDNPALAEADPEKESALDAVRGAACQNINLVSGWSCGDACLGKFTLEKSQCWMPRMVQLAVTSTRWMGGVAAMHQCDGQVVIFV
eukprot:1160739-Pelagomonas_calceolata.AAC.1